MTALTASNNVGKGCSSEQANALSYIMRAFNQKATLDINKIWQQDQKRKSSSKLRFASELNCLWTTATRSTPVSSNHLPWLAVRNTTAFLTLFWATRTKSVALILGQGRNNTQKLLRSHKRWQNQNNADVTPEVQRRWMVISWCVIFRKTVWWGDQSRNIMPWDTRVSNRRQQKAEIIQQIKHDSAQQRRAPKIIRLKMNQKPRWYYSLIWILEVWF